MTLWNCSYCLLICVLRPVLPSYVMDHLMVCASYACAYFRSISVVWGGIRLILKFLHKMVLTRLTKEDQHLAGSPGTRLMIFFQRLWWSGDREMVTRGLTRLTTEDQHLAGSPGTRLMIFSQRRWCCGASDVVTRRGNTSDVASRLTTEDQHLSGSPGTRLTIFSQRWWCCGTSSVVYWRPRLMLVGWTGLYWYCFFIAGILVYDKLTVFLCSIGSWGPSCAVSCVHVIEIQWQICYMDSAPVLLRHIEVPENLE